MNSPYCFKEERKGGARLYLNSPKYPLAAGATLGGFAFDLAVLLHFFEEFVGYCFGNLKYCPHHQHFSVYFRLKASNASL